MVRQFSSLLDKSYKEVISPRNPAGFIAPQRPGTGDQLTGYASEAAALLAKIETARKYGRDHSQLLEEVDDALTRMITLGQRTRRELGL